MKTGKMAAFAVFAALGAAAIAAGAGMNQKAIDAALASRTPTLDLKSVTILTDGRMKEGTAQFDGWAPHVTFKFYGKTEQGDVILARLKAKGKQIGEVTCSWDWQMDCRFGDEVKAKDGGKFAIDLVLRYTDAEMNSKEVTFATLGFNVIKYNVHPTEGVKFVVDYDNKVEEAYLIEDTATCGRVSLRFYYKTQGDKDNWKVEAPKAFLAKCFVGDKQIGGDVKSLYTAGQSMAVSYGPYKGMDMLPEIGWYEGIFTVPDLCTSSKYKDPGQCNDPATVYLAENPGDYTCKVMFDGTVVRELKFTVKPPEEGSPDPVIVPHPDQAKAFTGDWVLIKSDVKPGWKFDGKASDKAWKADGFWGLGRTDH